jgi:hypothetical protein
MKADRAVWKLTITNSGATPADAQNRAETLIKAVSGTVGSVRGVNSGPFQVTAADATDVESGGYYDTASIEKTVIATVTVDFETR